MICKNCGKEISDSSKFCPECGVKIEAIEEAAEEIQENEVAPVDIPEQDNWYFVEESQSKGPYNKEDMENYLQNGRINENTFVWKSGMSEWKTVKDTELYQGSPEENIPEEPKNEESGSSNAIDWYYISADSKQNGPFTRMQMINLIQNGTINLNTYIWSTGMNDWMFLKDSELAGFAKKDQAQQPNTYTAPVQNPMGMQTRSIALYIILSIVTCGIFGLYWLYTMANDVNRLTQGNEPQQTSAGMVLVLSIVTCGIYQWYWLYKCGKRLSAVQFNNGFRVTDDSVIMLILGIFGLSIVSYCILQSAINDAITYSK